MSRTTKEHQTGAAGVSEIQGKFERIGWGPVRNSEHDLGTDLLIAARDDRGFERGIVGAQAKSGPFWFKDPEYDSEGNLVGWWFYEDKVDHFEDWVRHPLPHLVVIHDLEADISYWAHLTPEAVHRVGKGCKALVPIEHTVDDAHLGVLVDIAAGPDRPPRLEGTAFAAGAESISPARRLRVALLAPRLVAPHRNTGYGRPIEPEEAIALLALGRTLDFSRFAEKFDEVPDHSAATKHRDWRWRFFSGLWQWLVEEHLTGLTTSASLQPKPDAPDSPSKAAAAIALSVAHRQAEDNVEALTALGAVLEKDDLGPVDLAWVLAQRARLRMELGDTEGAVADAVAAMKNLRAERNDLTASAIAASAAWQIFRSSDVPKASVGDPLTAADTAVAWWRGQLVAGALSEANLREFRTWAEDTANRWSAEDTERNHLFAAALNADLAADHGSWRAHESLRARDLLLTAHDKSDLVEGLDSLRRSGDWKSLELAARHVRAVGPLEALRQAVARVREGSWTHTTFKTNLTLLSVAGDLLPPSDATAAAHLCLGLLSGDRDDFIERLQPGFIVALDALEALGGTLRSADVATHEAASAIIVSGRFGDAILQGPAARVVSALDIVQLSDETALALKQFGISQNDRLGAAVLGRFKHDLDDAEADSVLKERGLGGDAYALGAHGDVRTLDAEAVSRHVERYVAAVERTISNAKKSVYEFGNDSLRELALMNSWFPDVASWDSCFAALEHPRVAAEHKRGTADLLMVLAGQLPAEVRQRLSGVALVLGESKPMDLPGGVGIGGLPATLLAAMSPEIGPELLAQLVNLAGGTVLERCDLVAYLTTHDHERLRALLVGLAHDPARRVRVAAAHAIGRLAAKAPDDIVLIAVAEDLAEDDGADVPLALLGGIVRGAEATPPALVSSMRKLAVHPSPTVARRAKSALSGA